jgi:GntR family transcriptional regulator
MIIKLDLQSDVPIYTQLINVILQGIASEELQPGEPLPSVRSLAADLGINLHTVNKAYQLLKQEGYIQIHRQKGVVVNPEGMPKADEAFLFKLKINLNPLIAESLCRQMPEEEFITICRKLFSTYKRTEGKPPTTNE